MNRRDILAAIVFVLLLAMACVLVDNVTRTSAEAELELVRSAVKNAALTCYAVEGAYPEDIGYLREYYGLGYNEERYLVTYDAFASNVMPDIRVVERGVGSP